MLSDGSVGCLNIVQFVGLCEENLKPSSDGPATLCGDLQGFWDMMMLQVDNINESYDEIKKCRENGWTVGTEQVNKLSLDT